MIEDNIEELAAAYAVHIQDCKKAMKAIRTFVDLRNKGYTVGAALKGELVAAANPNNEADTSWTETKAVWSNPNPIPDPE